MAASSQTTAFYYVGVAAAVYLVLWALCKVFYVVNTYVVMKLLGVGRTDPIKMGKWAVVTGATDGIGKSYAQKLAKRGLSIVIISRTQSKLDTCAKELREINPNIEVKTIAADFSKTEDIYEQISAGLEGLEVGTLVNNVGLSYAYPEILTDVKDGEKVMTDMVNINCLSMVRMCQIVLPGMVSRSKGLILNLSSAAGTRPMPMLSVYSATKAFVVSFSQGLSAEYRGFGITVECITPMYVATKMSGLSRQSLFVPGPDTYAASNLATAGSAMVTCGYWPHDLQMFFMHRIPNMVYYPMILKQMQTIRAKTLKKLKRQS